jgi:hypothetical protein
VREVISEESASTQDEDTYTSGLNPNALEFQSSQLLGAREESYIIAVSSKGSRLLKGRIEGVNIQFCAIQALTLGLSVLNT